jgi:hypothetical protein
MNNHPSEQLAVFGKNRYHDWSIFFIIATVFIIASIGYSIWLYVSTKSLLNGSTDTVAAPSQFEAFKTEAETLSTYIKKQENISTTTAPVDPSLR